MKTKHLFLVILMGFIYASCSNDEQFSAPLHSQTKAIDDGGISQEQAIQIALNTTSANSEIYISAEEVSPNSSISAVVGQDSLKSPQYKSWFVFINDLPEANWSHPCKYLFINSQNGEYQTFEQAFPPKKLETMKIIRRAETDAITQPMTRLDIETRTGENPNTTGHQWAVIISGGISPANNHIRYWNDCSDIYKTLINVFNYHKGQIYVAMSDGTNPAIDVSNGTSSNLDLDADGIADIRYSATKASLNTIFNELVNKLTVNDDLLVFT